MHDRIRTQGATPATAADLADGSRAPSIASLIKVPPSREASRGLRDRLRVLSGGDASNLLGERGVAFVRQTGLAGAVAIGWALTRYRSTSDADVARTLSPDAVLPSGDLGDECYDLRETSTSEFAWDVRALAFSTMGQLILDGVVTGKDWPVEVRNAAHRWSDDLGRLLAEGPSRYGDERLFAHMQLLAEWGDYELERLDRLLKVCFALVERAKPIVLPADFGLDLVHQVMIQACLWDLVDDFAPEIDPVLDAPRRVRPRPAHSAAAMPSLFD